MFWDHCQIPRPFTPVRMATSVHVWNKVHIMRLTFATANSSCLMIARASLQKNVYNNSLKRWLSSALATGVHDVSSKYTLFPLQAVSQHSCDFSRSFLYVCWHSFTFFKSPTFLEFEISGYSWYKTVLYCRSATMLNCYQWSMQLHTTTEMVHSLQSVP